MSAAQAKNAWVCLAVVAVWAVAFALLEAMIVVCLRKLLGLQFRLTFLPRDVHYPRAHLGYERAREAATMVMLFAFGAWDVFYKVWPRVLLRRPAAPGTRDLLTLAKTRR